MTQNEFSNLTKEEKKKVPFMELPKKTRFGCFGLILLLIILIFAVKSCGFEKITNVTIKQSESQLFIINDGSDVYKDVTVTINDKYKAKFDELPANGSYTIGFMLFADKDGNRYDYTMKTQKVYISSENSKGNYSTALFELE